MLGYAESVYIEMLSNANNWLMTDVVRAVKDEPMEAEAEPMKEEAEPMEGKAEPLEADVEPIGKFDSVSWFTSGRP